MKKMLAFLMITLCLCFAVNTSADGVKKRVKFKAGKTSAVVSNAVVRGDRDTYTIGAKAKQTMTVKITSVEKNAVFQIQTPNGLYVAGADEGDDAMSWSGSLPETGDYQIIVGGTRGNAAYKLTVSVK